jgi:hypothetical protein
MRKIFPVALNTVPIFIMLGLIPIVQNDYFLTAIYILIIAIALAIRYERNDVVALIFGLLAMTLSEYGFISTGVETFRRNSLWGLMPLWLPLLWTYGFVTIKRSVTIINDK